MKPTKALSLSYLILSVLLLFSIRLFFFFLPHGAYWTYCCFSFKRSSRIVPSFYWVFRSDEWVTLGFLPGFNHFYRVHLGCYRVWMGFIGFSLGFIQLCRVFIGFHNLNWVFTGFYTEFILGFTGFHWVLPAFTGLNWLLLGYSEFKLVSISYTESLLGFKGFHWVSLGFMGFYWILLGFKGFYWV